MHVLLFNKTDCDQAAPTAACNSSCCQQFMSMMSRIYIEKKMIRYN